MRHLVALSFAVLSAIGLFYQGGQQDCLRQHLSLSILCVAMNVRDLQPNLTQEELSTKGIYRCPQSSPK